MVVSSILNHFADILEYPDPLLLQYVQQCENQLTLKYPTASSKLSHFRELVETMTSGQMEEVYSGTFELNSDCYPYIGSHLFGETYQRSVFLVELKERFRQCSFSASEKELPDHLSVLLRFIATDITLHQSIVQEAILPVLDTMLSKVPATDTEYEGNNPYQYALQSLQSVLQQL